MAATANDQCSGDRPLDQERAVDDVDVDEAVQPVGLRVAETDVDDAAHLASEARREVARVEVDLVQQSRLHEAGQAAEVIEAIDGGALELHLGVRGRRAANDDVGLSRASHAGHVFDGPQRIAAGSGHAQQLLSAEAALRDLARWGFDGGRGTELQRSRFSGRPVDVHAVGDRGELARGDLLLDCQRSAILRGDPQAVSGRGQLLETKRA